MKNKDTWYAVNKLSEKVEKGFWFKATLNADNETVCLADELSNGVWSMDIDLDELNNDFFFVPKEMYDLYYKFCIEGRDTSALIKLADETYGEWY